MKKNRSLLIALVIAVLIAAACTEKKGPSDVSNPQGAVQKNITGKQTIVFDNISAKISSIPKLDFMKVRDPFYTVFVQQPGSKEKKSKLKGKIMPTQKFEMGKYVLVGVMINKYDKHAILRDPEAKAWVVREGSPIGDEGARIKRITSEGVYVEEMMEDGSGKSKSSEVFISIKKY